MNKSKNTLLIKQKSAEIGFQYCGISKAEFLEEEAYTLENWLNNNMHGKMSYMQNHFDMRLDPSLIVPGAKSVISLLLNYFPEQKQHNVNFKISKYAYGADYHYVIKEKLHLLFEFIQKNIGEINGRVFVDSAPVMDKVWAKKGGLGWVGKNSNLINKQSGSFFFIAEIITDLELDFDAPIKDYCGTCTRCIDACPTDAIVKPYVVDGSKCISYLTIELKENIPSEFKGKMDNWIFGCDICQDVCPWNRFSTYHNEPLLQSNQDVLNFSNKEWEELTDQTFGRVFKNSAVKRTKFIGLKRNIEFLK